MRKMVFSTLIAAPRETVWRTMLGLETYRDWTSAFAEGSTYEGSWEKGSRIRFLGPDGSGMFSEIAESRPHELVSIRHLGEVKGGVEDSTSEMAQSWQGALETYVLTGSGAATELRVELDVTPEMEEFMASAWPKALARLAQICEEA